MLFRTELLIWIQLLVFPRSSCTGRSRTSGRWVWMCLGEQLPSASPCFYCSPYDAPLLFPFGSCLFLQHKCMEVPLSHWWDPSPSPVHYTGCTSIHTGHFLAEHGSTLEDFWLQGWHFFLPQVEPAQGFLLESMLDRAVPAFCYNSELVAKYRS